MITKHQNELFFVGEEDKSRNEDAQIEKVTGKEVSVNNIL